ncbi:MAG: murein biosynthesis integral membrane protein MurJ [Planctomycetota bacterium]
MPAAVQTLSSDAPAPAVARRSPFAAVRSLAGLTLGSRVLGLAREVMMAAALGTGLVADAFFLAWMLPNLFRRLFGEGAFAAALVPVFVEAREGGDPDGARRLVSAAVCRLALGLCLLVLGGEALCWWLGSGAGQDLLAGWLSPAAALKAAAVLDLARLLLPYVVLICVAGLLGGALNALDRFSIPALAPSVFNGVWIVALLVGTRLFPDALSRVRFLAVSLVAGGVVQLLMHTRAMARAGVPLQPLLRAEPERLRRVQTLFCSLALGLALFQLNAFLDGLIAYAFVSEGGVSALYYGNRLVQLPIGVLGVALATAVFPELTRLAKRGDDAGMWRVLDRGVALGAFVALPAAAGLAVLAEPLVRVLFQRGAFDAESAARTARVVLLLAPAVVAACVTPVITRAFYAEEEVSTPVRTGALCVALNLVLNLLLVGPMGEAGLALATSTSQCANLALQALLYRRRRVARGDAPRTLQTALSVLGCAALSAAMALATALAHRFAPGPAALRLGLAIAVGVCVYAGVALGLRLEPARLLLARRRA